MRAIILAAGRGRRLEASNPDGRPKCLLEIGGSSLLRRQLRIMHAAGLQQADLVIGYEADRIIEHVASLSQRPDVSFHYNPRHQLGSALSLAAANAALTSGEPVIVMDADVLFHPGILERLLSSIHANCFLLDRDFMPGEEPVKIAISGRRMVEFRKQLPAGLDYDVIGESVGFFRFDPAISAAIGARCLTYEQEGMSDAPHEEVLRELLLQRPGAFGYEDITGLPWVEVDFAEDVEKAEREVLPAIREELPDF